MCFMDSFKLYVSAEKTGNDTATGSGSILAKKYPHPFPFERDGGKKMYDRTVLNTIHPIRGNMCSGNPLYSHFS
jgi:hypothetical protein